LSSPNFEVPAVKNGKFLDEDVDVNPGALQSALEMVEAQKSTSVPNVILTDDEIVRLGLAA